MPTQDRRRIALLVPSVQGPVTNALFQRIAHRRRHCGLRSVGAQTGSQSHRACAALAIGEWRVGSMHVWTAAGTRSVCRSSPNKESGLSEQPEGEAASGASDRSARLAHRRTQQAQAGQQAQRGSGRWHRRSRPAEGGLDRVTKTVGVP